MADTSTKTKEKFEKELQALAAKAKQQTFQHQIRQQVPVILHASALLSLAAISSTVSQLSLSPVYGSIPSSIWHSQLCMTALFLGWSGSLFLQRHLPRSPLHYLPILAIYIPFIQYFLFPFSSTLGATWGPLVTESLTFFPLLLLSSASAALVLEKLDLGELWKPFADAVPGVASFALYRGIEVMSASALTRTIGRVFLLTRLGLQILLGGLYAVRFPSSLLVFTLPAVLHTALFNVHVQSGPALARLNVQLGAKGWEMLARADSVTGYVSILESKKEGFRVMRCDHSLLGGEWLPSAVPVKGIVGEPIYAIFAMLEAVRLVEVPIPIQDKDASALVIGLGIGTTPSALIAHGISTTIVEIDPIVHAYATKYFSLPRNHIPVIADAITYAAHLANSTSNKYDYIVHDVFTGGAEPVDLFTVEFMADLHRLLKPQGVIAINYAGDLLLPTTALIARTITSTFPSCRIYRESAAPSAATLARDKQDFTNMVIFCRKQGDAPISFRKPVEADYLDSPARRAYMMPQVEISWDGGFGVGGGMQGKGMGVGEGEGEMLRRNGTEVLRSAQMKSAVGHWVVMRTVVEGGIWELW